VLENIINFLAYGSLVFAAIAAYLQLNKLWTRKHLPDVAESISIPGILVESIPLLFFGIYFLFNGELIGIVDSAIWLISAVIVTMIGTGFWVKGQRKRGLWKLLKGAVSRERSELTSLARELFAPAAAPQLIGLLTMMAAVDGTVDERERSLVQAFAREWGLDIDWSAARASASSGNRLVETRQAFSDYLDTAPPYDQVAHLQDILNVLINADETVSVEERVIFDEISGQVRSYISSEGVGAGYAVVLVPQGDAQDEAISTLLKGVESRTYAGGNAYVAGDFFSKDYAEVIRDEYRALGFFTVIMHESEEVAT